MSQYACLNDLQSWLDSYLNFEKTPKKNIFWLDTMQFLCEKTGHPEKTAPCIHVAGSKGKGSTSAFISAILEEAGYKTGLYTSPHILDFAERIGSAHGVFPQEVYEKAAQTLKDTIQSIPLKNYPGERPVTWFELVTLYGFLCFKEAGCDWNVFETGLGGRLDSTNVITPEVCVIGPIELEHTEFLGDTLEKIAFEKGGIIKEGVPIIIAGQKESVKEVFRSIAEKKHAPVYFADECGSFSVKINTYSQDFTLNCIQNSTHLFNSTTESLQNNTVSDNIATKNIQKQPTVSQSIELTSPFFSRPLKTTTRLLGDFQAENALNAAIAVKLALPDLSEDIIERGLSRAFLSGRFEITDTVPPLVLDGAHTVKSISYTLSTFRTVFPSVKPTVLFACAADKDMKDIAPLFKDFYSKLFLTIPGLTKQSNLEALHEAFKSKGLAHEYSEDFVSVIKQALMTARKKNEPLLVTGSFYLVSEVKKYLAENSASL